MNRGWSIKVSQKSIKNNNKIYNLWIKKICNDDNYNSKKSVSNS